MNGIPQDSHSDSQGHAPRLRRRTLGGYRYVRMRWRLLFGCVDTIGGLLFAIARFLSCWLPSRNRDGETRRILLVQFDHLGDAVITTGVFAALQQHFPNARIDVLAAPWNRAVFDSAAEVQQVFLCRHNRFAADRSLAWIPATLAWGLRLRRERYDLAIDVRGEFPHNVLLWLTGAPRRLGWASGGGGFLLTHRPAFLVNRPELESRAALLECLGIHGAVPLRPTFQPSLDATETAKLAWNELDMAAGSGSKIILHIGAGTSAKRWPAEHWRHLVTCLRAERHATVALVGTSSDTQTAQAILGGPSSPHVADWTGRFSVDELAGVLQQADVLVGADSGPAHLAIAVGTSVVALFSGTNSIEQWQPRGIGVRVLHSDVSCSPCHRTTCPIAGHPCMRTIQPTDVVHSLVSLLPDRLEEALMTASPRSGKGPIQ